MGLRNTIASAVTTAFSAVDDVAETVTYRRISGEAYNPATGTVSATTTDIAIKAIIAPFGATITPAELIATETTNALSVIIQSTDLDNPPESDDQIIRGSIIYAIKNIIFDPAGATYRLIVSKQS